MLGNLIPQDGTQPMNDYYGDAKVHCKVVISDPEYSENEAESEPSHE